MEIYISLNYVSKRYEWRGFIYIGDTYVFFLFQRKRLLTKEMEIAFLDQSIEFFRISEFEGKLFALCLHSSFLNHLKK